MTSAAPTSAVPSGEQFEIRFGDQRAVIVEVGGGIRVYDVGGRAVLESYPLDVRCDGGHGAVLAPWPNRLADGRYSFDGVDHQLPLTEPERSNAIHGLVRWRNWEAVDHAEDQVVMGTMLDPTPGYPYSLRVEVGYRLDTEGLRVVTTATNLGTEPCPYACGHHPYLSPGTGSIDDAAVELRAPTRIVTDAERQVPTGSAAVNDTAFDLSGGRSLHGLVLDDAFTDLERDGQGRAWVRLAGNDGRGVGLWVDEAYPVIQLFTGDTLAPDRARRGLAAEPMTAPANALQTGDHLVRLEPGEAHVGCWGVRLV